MAWPAKRWRNNLEHAGTCKLPGKLLLFCILLLLLVLVMGQTSGESSNHMELDYHLPTEDWTDPAVWKRMLSQDPYWIYSLLYRNRTTPYRCQRDETQAINFTIVTGVIDIKRDKWPRFRRKFDNYLHYSVPLLQMNIPIVIFVEPKVKPFVEFYRRGKEHLTKIILTDIRDLEYYEDYDVIQAIMRSSTFRDNHGLLNHPEGFSPEYNIVTNSKASLLFKASRWNFFQTDYFYWVDMGYGHGNDIFPRSCHWVPRSLMESDLTDQITFVQLTDIKWVHDIADVYKKRIPPLISGGFFGGNKNVVQEYYLLHKTVFRELLERNVIDDDQTIVVACYLKRPDLFNLVWGTWYDAFNLFNY